MIIERCRCLRLELPDTAYYVYTSASFHAVLATGVRPYLKVVTFFIALYHRRNPIPRTGILIFLFYYLLDVLFKHCSEAECFPSAVSA